MKIRYIGVIALLVLTTGCGRQKTVNLSVAKKRVIEYYEGGRYQKDLKCIAKRTKRCFKYAKPKKNSLVIFDIDDTLLSSYEKQKAISFGYIPKLFSEWVLQADAPIIPEMKNLYDYFLNRGYKIVLLTGRKYNEYDATVKNLKNHGITQFEELITRQPHELKMKAIEYKPNRRKELTEKGYKIVACIGDQHSDLKGGYSGLKVKVPNYGYEVL